MISCIRALIIFGLNALNGRSIQSDGSAVGAWDSTNAKSFMRYTVGKGYKIYGWELGKNALHSYMLICILYRKMLMTTQGVVITLDKLDKKCCKISEK